MPVPEFLGIGERGLLGGVLHRVVGWHGEKVETMPICPGSECGDETERQHEWDGETGDEKVEGDVVPLS